MQFMNLLSVIVWSFIAFRALVTFFTLRRFGLSRREITAITILLLAALNITRGTIATLVDIPTSHLLLEYFYIGSSVFQILLCQIVLKYINSNKVGK